MRSLWLSTSPRPPAGHFHRLVGLGDMGSGGFHAAHRQLGHLLNLAHRRGDFRFCARLLGEFCAPRRRPRRPFSLPGFAGPGRFDGGVEGQEVGLLRRCPDGSMGHDADGVDRPGVRPSWSAWSTVLTTAREASRFSTMLPEVWPREPAGVVHRFGSSGRRRRRFRWTRVHFSTAAKAMRAAASDCSSTRGGLLRGCRVFRNCPRHHRRRPGDLGHHGLAGLHG